MGTNSSALIDLKDLPSKIVDEKKSAKSQLAERDGSIRKAACLRNWEAKKVRAFVICYEYGKRRCIYSKTNDGYVAAMGALQQKLESVSESYSCGDLLFNDDHPLSKILVQRQNLSCESQIEKGYYNNTERRLKLKDICVYCGAMGSSDFLYGMEELRSQCRTGGFKCLPICADCLGNGRKIVTVGKKDVLQERKEKAKKEKALRERAKKEKEQKEKERREKKQKEKAQN
eukprot:CAMPEP_0183718134 /NCGR_PEP_ID=MMETSP0737-20130205/11470_1 /TAXON_ID=385413 /ORGANISM="Thalassiosira miniscula, Strain CCMP1093" /LENGTH=229 /DNA_ID=CAMNT_0025947633 /DNA_START=271 /DNA_END=960 /DNA_ORIENTATION=+